MYRILATILLFVQLMLLASCGVPKNFHNAVYLKDSVTEAEKNVVNKTAVIRHGDRLDINITATNKIAADEFNVPHQVEEQGITGYLVDSLGNILLLQLGLVHVEGLTPAELQANLQQQLENYIKEPVVSVVISNFKVNVFGEVARPGIVIVPDGKMTILEALVQSGDLTLYAKRDGILVIREQGGKREFGRVDISSNHIFESPYYNLQQNDVIYVEPDKTKFISNDFVTNRNIRNLGIFLTLLSTTLLLVSIFK